MEDFKVAIIRFEADRKERLKFIKNASNLREKFLRIFPIEKIKHMTLNEYVSGKPQSFCYWLDTALKDLGNISNSSFASKKFGVYYNNSQKKYISLSKYGKNPEEAFENIKGEIMLLLEAGRKENISAIKTNKLSPMFKGKILSTYFPEKYLNVFSDVHLDHFMKYLKVYTSEKINSVEKRDRLLKVKNAHHIMKNWSIEEFSIFLYEYFPKRPTLKRDLPTELQEYADDAYPEIDTIEPIFITPDFNEIIKKEGRTNTQPTKKKTDYDASNRKNRKLGNQGEIIVLKAEQLKLKEIGRHDLAVKVRQVSIDNDNLGYDIESFDECGQPKFIEVKSTKAKGPSVSFHITSNEYSKNTDYHNHYVYLVLKADTCFPEIIDLTKLSDIDESKISFKPESYLVSLNLAF